MDATAALEGILAHSGDENNPGPEAVRGIMESVKRIAVVGISRNPEKAARRVPSYLAAQGYDIVPVNPFVDEILGKTAVDSLDEVTDPVDMVLVFRPSEEAAVIAETALARPEKPVVWLQQGILAPEVARRARDQGFTMVQDLCAYEVHQALTR